jgi:hypothetical protein
MGELAPRDYYDPTPMGRQVRKQLARIDEQARVRQAAITATSQDDLSQIVAQQRIAQERINGGYDLADHAVSRATHLNHKVTAATRDNPGLEMTLRDMEHKTGLGATIVVYDYMTRR